MKSLITVCIGLAVLLFLYKIVTERSLAAHRTALLKHVDHAAIAQGCVELIAKYGSDQEFGVSFGSMDTNLPLAIRAANPMWVKVRSNDVIIMKTGGHYHMGLHFKQSRTNSSRFDLVFQEDRKGSDDLLLYSIAK